MHTGVPDNAGKPATAARIYDYYLGGTHNFPADREAAEKIIASFPSVTSAARANRGFLGRAVRHLAEAGVRQFLDLGSGIPTQGNVHEIVATVDPTCRVVYVDLDPVAVAESMELLRGNSQAAAVCADLRDPTAVLAHPTVGDLIDFGRPVAVVLASVLPFVTDDDAAAAIVATLRDRMVPGSYLVLSHAAVEGMSVTPERVAYADQVYRSRTTSGARFRSREDVLKLFTGLRLLEPGLVWLPQWRPDASVPADMLATPSASMGWAGVGQLSDPAS